MASLGPHHNASSVSPPPLPALLFTEQRQKERLREREKVGNSHPVLLYRRQKERETVTRYGYIGDRKREKQSPSTVIPETEREGNSHPVRLYRRQKERETVTQYRYIGDRKRETVTQYGYIGDRKREKQSSSTAISGLEKESK